MEHRFQGAWAVSEFRRGKAEGKLEALRDSVIEFLDELQGDSVLIRERILAEESVDVNKSIYNQIKTEEFLNKKESIVKR